MYSVNFVPISRHKSLVLGVLVGGIMLPPGAAAAGELSDLANRITSLDSVGVVATVRAQFIDPERVECCPVAVQAGGVVEGSYSYAAEDTKWRIDSYLDPSQYPGMNTSMIFDGGQFAYQDNEQSILSLQSGVPAESIGMVLPNPTFEMIQFLLPLGDHNSGHETQLSDAKMAASAADLTGVAWSPAVFEGKALDVAVFPGSVYEGVAYEHRVYAKPAAHDRPLVIDRVDTSGNILTRTRLSVYQDVVSVGEAVYPWPKRVNWQVFDPSNGALVVQMTMDIEWMMTNEPGALSIGTFDTAALSQVDTVVIDGILQP